MSLKHMEEHILHGRVVQDPYLWLEDRTLPETADWIQIQQRSCERYFAGIPDLPLVEARVRDYLDVEEVDQPFRVQDRYFYRKRRAGQEQGALCVRDISQRDERVLVDPSPAGKYTSVGIHRISADGALLAYELRAGGEDRQEIHLIDVETGIVLPNKVPLGYGRGFSFSRNGYFYSREADSTDREHNILFQPFGSVGSSDVVFRVPHIAGSRLVLTSNSQRLGALWSRPLGMEVLMDFWIADLIDGTRAWKKVFESRRVPYSPILCRDQILVLTGTEDGHSRLVPISTEGKELREWVLEKRAPIQQIAVTRDRLFICTVERGVSTLDAWTFDGQLVGSAPLPQGGTIRFLPNHSNDSDCFFYAFESFDTPPEIYLHEERTNRSVLWHQRGPSRARRPRQVVESTYPSKDGSLIPLTLVSLKDFAHPERPRPVIMTSYGGFGVTLTPQYSTLASILMERGATLALPHIRGGGEFGQAWHEAGRARNRQAAFDDFIAAAEWLFESGRSTPRQLAIFGGSNSGLLVGCAMTQRPDLFRAVLCIAPLLDMIRYESFGRAARWRREYGTVESSEDFQVLHSYSPYHHIAEDVNYPATLLVSGDKDDRCHPAHARKMAARLQDRPAQKAPVILDYSPERGHAPALPLSDRIAALARRIAFLCREIQIPMPGGGPDETAHP